MEKALNPQQQRRKIMVPLLAILGLVSLSYVLGAAAMFFEVPPSDFLHKAFVGARAWNERRQASVRSSATATGKEVPHAPTVKIDKPGKTFDGFTLYTMYAPESVTGTQALLINMEG